MAKAKAKKSTRSKRATKTATKTKEWNFTCTTPNCRVKGEENFSPLKGGGYSHTCKKCRRKASKEWTTARADLRTAQQEARKYIRNGIPAIVPDAKTWEKGDAIMTYGYKENGKTIKSQEAKPLYEAIVAERDAQRAELRRIKEEAKAKEREERRLAREQAKAEREAERAKARAEKQAERERKAKEWAKARAEKNRKIAEKKRKEALAEAEKARQEILKATGKA